MLMSLLCKTTVKELGNLTCVTFCRKHRNGEYATRETETTASCIDHLSTNSCNETNCKSVIKSDLTDHHGLHHKTS